MKKSIDAMGSIGGIIDRGFECGFDEDERFLRGDAHARKFDAVNDDAVNDAKEIEIENATRRVLVLRRSSTAKTRRRTTSANVGKVRKVRRRLGRNEI